MRRPSAPIVAVSAGAVFSVVVLAVPSVRVFYDNARLRVALDALEGAVAVVLAYVWWGRLSDRGLLRDAMLVFTLAVLGGVSLTLAIVPQTATNHQSLLWTAAAWRLLAAAALALAAIVPGRLRSPRKWLYGAAGALLLGVVAGLLGHDVDLGLARLDIDDHISFTNVRGHPLLAVILGTGMVLYAVAAVAFAHRATRSNDRVLVFLSAGACFAALARVHYVLFPSLYTSLVYSGDVLRLAAYVAFGAAAAREIRRYWNAVSVAAVAAERRRAARDLHDGLAQELAFIRSRVVEFARRSPESPELAHVAESAERALAESRQLIVVLTGQGEQFEDLEPHLQQAGDDVARRLGVDVEVSASHAPPVRQESAFALARVVREAVTNAAVHGNATTVRVEVTEHAERLVVAISDDGGGFDPGSVRPGGFGLISIRERVAGLGGELTIESLNGVGTCIRVAIPRDDQQTAVEAGMFRRHTAASAVGLSGLAVADERRAPRRPDEA